MELKTPVRLVLCDDHRIITDGLQRLLQDAAWVECVGTAASGKELLFLLEQLPADIILLDLDMPGMDGAEAMQQVKDRWPRTKVIILTMHDGPSMVRRLMAQGADAAYYPNLRAHETVLALVCRLLIEKKTTNKKKNKNRLHAT